MAPFSNPRQHNLVLIPLMHNPVAHNKAKLKIAETKNRLLDSFFPSAKTNQWPTF